MDERCPSPLSTCAEWSVSCAYGRAGCFDWSRLAARPAPPAKPFDRPHEALSDALRSARRQLLIASMTAASFVSENVLIITLRRVGPLLDPESDMPIHKATTVFHRGVSPAPAPRTQTHPSSRNLPAVERHGKTVAQLRHPRLGRLSRPNLTTGLPGLWSNTLSTSPPKPVDLESAGHYCRRSSVHGECWHLDDPSKCFPRNEPASRKIRTRQTWAQNTSARAMQ